MRIQHAVLVLAFWMSVGCGATQAEPRGIDEQSAGECSARTAGFEELEADVFVRRLSQNGLKVWLYSPCEINVSLPLVLVAPAGSNLLTGMALAEGDQPEHIPYVRAGYAVAAYEIAGPMEEDTDEAFLTAFVAFYESEAGLSSARAALDLALDTFPSIDPQRVFAAGHSSAATLALLVAARDERITAVAAYAPVTDVAGGFATSLADFEGAIPGYGDFLRGSSPINLAAELAHKPVFLFHALEDQVVLPIETERLFDAMENRHGASVRETAAGDHYRPMFSEGIPGAISWFATLE